MTWLTAESWIFGNEGNHSVSTAAFFAVDLGTKLTLNLFFEFFSALWAHFWGLFASFGHELSWCELGVDGCMSKLGTFFSKIKFWALYSILDVFQLIFNFIDGLWLSIEYGIFVFFWNLYHFFGGVWVREWSTFVLGLEINRVVVLDHDRLLFMFSLIEYYKPTNLTLIINSSTKTICRVDHHLKKWLNSEDIVYSEHWKGKNELQRWN